MKGDFTRNTFDPGKHFLRVLMQQGRVQLDADWNEQAAILIRYLQSLARDLIGDHAGVGDSFKIVAQADGFGITAGHYYVDGILCENPEIINNDGNVTPLGYYDQEAYPKDPETEGDQLPSPPYLVYLDVWERLVTYIQDDSIREVALGGPDTAARSKIIWQVKVTNKAPGGGNFPTTITRADLEKLWPEWVNDWQPANRGRLKAKGKQDTSGETDPCTVSPDARYRGAENQLYRVEIHRGGIAWDGKTASMGNAATFKWSRDNGSVIFPVRSMTGKTVTLENLGRDDRSTLKVDDWVEVVDDDNEYLGVPGSLYQVDSVDSMEMTATLRLPESGNLPDYDEERAGRLHPLLRRWDQKAGVAAKGGLTLTDGAALIQEGSDTKYWLNLEDGIQIQFQPGATYRSGDYWLIPARTATGDVEWPGPVGNPEDVPPLGVEHHYAPLAGMQAGAAAGIVDLRDVIQVVSKPA